MVVGSTRELFGLAACVWGLGCFFVTARAAGRRDKDGRVRLFAAVLPAFAAVSLLLMFAAFPARGPALRPVLWIHRTAFSCLFLFLAFAQYLQEQARWRSLYHNRAAVARSVKRLWILSEVAPAPIAVAILLTGLRLIWEVPANTPDNFWLLAIILSFSFFFFDGIFGYQPIVRRMWQQWSRWLDDETAVCVGKNWWPSIDRLQLFIHFASWPLVFVLGTTRWNPPNPISPIISAFEHRLAFLPPGWPGVTTALALWSLAGLIVMAIRKVI
jgi:hypothetical protein